MAKMPAFQSATGKVGLPDRTFTDKLTLFSGRESVDLYYFGAGHTNGDAFVVFRDVRVMHAGDIFATKGLPLLDVPLVRLGDLEMAYNINDCVEIRWGALEGSEEASTCKRHAPAAQRKKIGRAHV